MRKFTAEDDQFLKDNYLTIPAKRMSKMLGRSESSGRQRMRILKLITPPEVVEKFKQDSRFSNGHISFNKGKKQADYMSADAIEKQIPTRFKKGRKPHNTKAGIGHIVVRMDTKSKINYKYIKLADSNWQLLHRVTYEKKYGAIPEGMLVAFKDKNPMNCTIENLELISMSENLERNSDRQYPLEIRKAIRTLNKLNKTIKNHEKQN